MSAPDPTPIYRFLHVENLPVCLKRGGLHAPNFTPADGMVYRTIHNPDIQQARRVVTIFRGPGGVIHDYVSFYFGARSPMLYQLHTGWVDGYTGGQEPLIYVVSTAQRVRGSSARFVFSDGHGIATFTQWYDDLADLEKVDWEAVHARIWKDTVDDMDRQRRKQAEFLVHRVCDWGLIDEIGVLSPRMKSNVEGILAQFPPALRRPVRVRTEWYY
jgi:hypothetical protein